MFFFKPNNLNSSWDEMVPKFLFSLAVSPGLRLPGQWLGEALIFYRRVLATDLHHDSLDIPGCGIMTSCTWINEMPSLLFVKDLTTPPLRQVI